nr:MAG TPA: Rad52/22 family double-strand break repair protein [Caudoviricetes sp.]
MEIRLLKANEIECRIGTVKEGKGISLLLYKDARVDMRILDEVFGFDGWEREHQLIDGKLFCTVRVWSEKRGCWISKQDVGTESNTEKEKGQVSDSFKRACFNLGIGRELYTAPFIWIPASKGYNKYEKFEVKEIGYNEDREINKLVIVDSKGKEAFRMGNNYSSNKNNGNNKNELLEKVYALAERKGYSKEAVNSLIAKKGFDISNFNNEAFKVMFEGYSKLEDKNKVGA